MIQRAGSGGQRRRRVGHAWARALPSARLLELAAVALLVLCCLAAPAWAAEGEPELLKMRFFERGSQLLISTSLTKLFDSTSYDKLDSGFASTVVIRFWVYPKGDADPVSFQLVQRRVIYDLWDELYVLELDEPGGRRIVKVKYKAEALKLLTAIESLPVAALARVAFEKHHVLAMVVELNPVSQETLAEVRRWLSDGTGGGLDRGGSFFGSFVSVFVNLKIPAADRVLRIRSQPFYRPPPAPAPSPAAPPAPRPRSPSPSTAKT